VHDLVSDPSGVEWRDKVGVAGPVDGSAKPTTRLVAVRGWVVKTRLDLAQRSRDAVVAALVVVRQRGERAGVWHPDKVWGAYLVEDDWYPFSICRELATFRRIAGFVDRARAWTAMLRCASEVAGATGLGLDLNPANFGTTRDGALHYLDDELYDRLEARDVAGAIVARIPEEATATPEDWTWWGSALRDLPGLPWADIRDEIARYPLPERYVDHRRALLDALVEPVRGVDDIVCLIADVHGNLAALEAVIEDAIAYGAKSFLFLGDVVGYGPAPAACIRRLAELRYVAAIRGNHDHAIASGRYELGMNSLARECAAWTREQLVADELAWLSGLPIEHVDEWWMAVHGAPRDPQRFLAYVYELTYEDNLRNLHERRIPVCFYGHTHVQLTHTKRPAGIARLPGVRELALDPRSFWLVNPGSVGQPRDGDPRAAYALWHRDTAELKTLRVSYDIEHTVAEIERVGLPAKLAHRLRVGA